MARANSNFTLVGNITRDIEIKLTSKQTKYCFVTLAINSKDKTDFVSVLAWDKLAETFKQYCKKGDAVAIAGHIGTISRDKRTEITLTADSMSFIHGRKNESAPAPAENPAESKFETITAATDPFAPF